MHGLFPLLIRPLRLQTAVASPILLEASKSNLLERSFFSPFFQTELLSSEDQVRLRKKDGLLFDLWSLSKGLYGYGTGHFKKRSLYFYYFYCSRKGKKRERFYEFLADLSLISIFFLQVFDTKSYVWALFFVVSRHFYGVFLLFLCNKMYIVQY